MNISSRMYMYELPKMTPYRSRGTTFRFTSSIKLATMEHLILHCLVNFNFASLFSHSNRYGFGWSWTSSPNFLTISVVVRLAYNPESNRTSIFVFLACIFLRFTYLCNDIHTIFSSTSKLLSTWFLESVAMRLFFLLSFFFFFGFNSWCKFQHFSSVSPSML